VLFSLKLYFIYMRKLFLFVFLFFLSLSSLNAQTEKTYNQHLSYLKSNEPLKVKINGLFGQPIQGVTSIMLSAVGPAFCFGDIGGSLKEQAGLVGKDFVLTNTRYLFEMGLRHVFENNMAIKATANYGNFGGTDAGSRNESRGYSFKTNVYELILQGEYILYGGPYSKALVPHTLYVFGGGGIMNCNVKFTASKGLRAGDTTYPTSTAPVFPVGFGYQCRINNNLTLGSEFGWHIILSDYVDGIHALGSKSNDVLSVLTFTFSYKIHSSIRNPDRCNCDNIK